MGIKDFICFIKKGVNQKEILRSYIIDELSREIKDIKNLTAFIQGFSKKQLKDLCKLLSDSRENSVYEKITDKKCKWVPINIPIEKIYLRNMNPKMKDNLKKYDYNLVKFGNSREIKKYKELEYVKPERDILLAEEENGKITLIDGCHRAISMAKDRKKIKLYLKKS